LLLFYKKEALTDAADPDAPAQDEAPAERPDAVPDETAAAAVQGETAVAGVRDETAAAAAAPAALADDTAASPGES
jgi:hypothetical protein